MAKNGIDVSRWQGEIDWSKVNIDFCIAQGGYGRETSQKDPFFEKNYAGCKSRKIPFGAYWYSYAVSEEEARREAEVCLEVLKGKQFEYPVFYDVEEQKTLALGREKVSAIIKAFFDTLEKSGYFVGLYMSSSFLRDYVTDDIKKRYAVWVAEYGVSKPNYSGTYGVWQKSSAGKISGINGNVSLDESYEDYPAIIKAAGLNGFAAPKPPVQAAKAVTLTIDGKTYSGTLTEVN